MAAQETKSPLKARPLRHAGQSLDEEIRNLVEDKGLMFALTGVLSVMLAALEWLRWTIGAPPYPVLVSVVAAPIAIYCAWRVVEIQRKLRDLKLGRDGERAVGEYLDRIRTADTRVLHDLLGDGFNIDHVLIAPQGIFAIETKTRSKPLRGDARIRVSEEGVSINGGPYDPEVLRQAAAQRASLRDLLKESTGRDWPIRSAVLFPGWFVERSQWSVTDDLWVLNPKALPTFFPNEPAVLGPEDVHIATFHLSRYIRTR